MYPPPNRTHPRPRARSLIAAGAAALIVAAGVVGLTSTASVARPALDPADVVAPVASYTFDTASGSTVADSSGKGNDAAWKGTPSYVPGVSGTAISVSGGANYVKLPLVAGQTDASASFSYEFWILENSRTSYGPIVSNQDFVHCDDSGTTLYNEATPGVLQACWGKTAGGTTEYVDGISDPILDAWHHVAVVVDRTANKADYYVDGVRTTGSPDGSITSDTAFKSGLAFNIGGLSGSEVDAADGYTNAAIDNFEFFDAAIPGTQVAADYAASKPTSASYTIAFDGNGSTGGTTASKSVDAGKSATLTKNGFTRPGYEFKGWALTKSGPVTYADEQNVAALSSTPGATVTLYAVWNKFRAAGDTIAPVVSYDFDDDSGTAVTDKSGNGNDGAWSGSASYADGISGKSAYVNSPEGSKQGVNFFSLPLIGGQTDASSSFSYVFWLNEASSSTDSPVVSNQEFTHCYDKGSTLYNTNAGGVLRACFGQNGTSTTQHYLPEASPDSVIGAWHQVALVADRGAGTMTTYLDGEQTVQSNDLTSAFTLNSGFPFRVGAEGSGKDTVDGFINANIDDFDFYSAPVSAEQVKNDYDATKPATPPSDSGSSIDKGFVSDTFRAPQVQAGKAFSQAVSGLWNGEAVTSYTKVSGDDWLDVDANGLVTGTAPAEAPQDPATITVEATDGDTTSQVTVEVEVLGASESPQLATATWNLWDAGSHVSDSVFKDLAVIAANGLDVIGVQDDGGTVATALAQSLGWYSAEGDGGVGIVSAYPLDSVDKPADALPAVGATVHTPGRDLRAWSVGLDKGDYSPEAVCSGDLADADAIVAAEKASKRFTQASAVAETIGADVKAASDAPLVLLGDLESPSASDWTADTSAAHCGTGAVDWPVPDLLAKAGLTDSFRAANPDPAKAAGNTWSPIVTKTESGDPEPQDRIDYVGFAGKRLSVLGSNTLVAGFPSSKDVQGNSWTSNHRAVVTTFRLTTTAAPTVTVTKDAVAYQVGSSPSADDLLGKAGAASPDAGATLQVDSSAVDFGTAGDYTATVTATDPASGLSSKAVEVTVHVVPVVAITLGKPDATIELGDGETLTEETVKAALQPSLNVPGTITVDITGVDGGQAGGRAKGSVAVKHAARAAGTAPGTYPVTVTGTDGFGFTATADTTVVVTAADPGTPTDEPTDTPTDTPTGPGTDEPTDGPTDSGPGAGTPTSSPSDSGPGNSGPSGPAGGSGQTPGSPAGSGSHPGSSHPAGSGTNTGTGLPRTGANIWAPLGLAVFLVLLGAVVLIRRRAIGRHS